MSEVPVTVNLIDRNDNFPEFTRNIYEVNVQENCEVGTTVAWVQALDDDSGKFGTQGVRYTSIAGSIENMQVSYNNIEDINHSKFLISRLFLHPITGIITVKTAGGSNWDREQVSRHYLTVEARDDLGNGNRNNVQLIINIDDVNDNAPIFNKNKYEARLLENRPDFESELKLEARDGDVNGKIFMLKGTESDKLSAIFKQEPKIVKSNMYYLVNYR